MIKGFVAPNGRPGYLFAYKGGLLDLQGRRTFIVDDKAEKVIDKPGEPLVLTPDAYKDLLAKITSGAPMVVEPDAVDALTADERAELEALRKRVAELEAAKAPKK
jgi:hypothetical protein